MAKEALVQPISAWLHPGLEFPPPPIAAFPFVFTKKDYDALSS